MRYILKVDNQYLTSDGSLSDSQRDAIKVDIDPGVSIRPVKLRPHGTPPRQRTSDRDRYPDTCFGGSW